MRAGIDRAREEELMASYKFSIVRAKPGNSLLHMHHIVGRWTQSTKAFGGCEYSFCPAVPMRSHATMALTAASVAPIAMISLKACTNDSAIACPINCLVVCST